MEDQNKVLEEVLDVLTDDAEAMIQDNKLMFSFEDKLYRARMPSQKERTLAKQAKDKEYFKLVKEGLLPFEKDLIKELKEKQGVDIEAMQKELDKLSDEYIQIALSLSTKKDVEEKAIALFKEKMAENKLQRRILSIQKGEKLSASIENQALDVFYKMLTSSCTEKLVNQEEDKWEKVWKNFEEFDNDDTKLPLIAGGKFVDLFFRS